MHVLLDRDAARLETVPPDPLISIHRLTSVPGRGLTAVRPDGYIGFRGQVADAGQLAAHPDRRGQDMQEQPDGIPADGKHPVIIPAPAARLARDRGVPGRPEAAPPAAG